MDSTHRQSRDNSHRCWGRTVLLVGWLAIVILSFGSPGCNSHDNRISIFEFIEMQEQVVREAALQPTSQPSRSTQEVWATHAFAPYRVGPSDVLSVALTGLEAPTLTAVYSLRVHSDGSIALPLVGRVDVGGLQLEELETVIEAAYVPNVVKNLSVITDVQVYKTTDILVNGAVATPGLTPLNSNQLNCLQAVAAAGGVSYLASGNITLKRVRRPGEEATFNVLDPVNLEAVFALNPLQPGDIVNVEAAEPSVIYVGGLVNAPGPQTIVPGTEISLLQTLAAAGGTISLLEPSEGTLIRRMPDGTDVHVELDMSKLQTGEHPNIMLAAGDILWVPDTFETKMLAWVQQNLFFRMGIAVTGSFNANGSYSARGIDWLNRRDYQKASGAIDGINVNLQDQFDPFGFFGN